jgi:parallel beta-helix repeat protein
VPSGLPVVPALDNPARAEAAAHNVGSGGLAVSGEPRTLTVQPGESIQDVVDLARPGDTVMISYGTYNERVVVDFNDISILGIANDAGEWPTLDGQGEMTEAIISSGNNFEVGKLRVVNYTDNGILVEGVTGVHMHDIYAENVGTYGLYPVQSTDVLIEDSEVIGADDAGIYAGQCENVVVRNNVVHGNVLGIELENTVGGEIYGNHAYDNTNGILIVLLPQLTSQVSLNTLVYDNLVENNNHVNFAESGTAASLMPAGAGIGIVAADHVEVYDNEIRGNNTAGVGIFSLLVAYDANEVDIGPTPEHIYIHDNVLEGNGSSPDGLIADMGIPGADVLWDVSGTGVQINLAQGSTSFPPAVPSSDWPEFAYRIYWRTLNFLIGLIG